MKVYRLAAGPVNGIYAVEEIPHNAIVYIGDRFQEELCNLTRTIYGVVNQTVYDSIGVEYGYK